MVSAWVPRGLEAWDTDTSWSDTSIAVVIGPSGITSMSITSWVPGVPCSSWGPSDCKLAAV
eukprot:4729378-Amphidinium_carterae.1